MKTFSEFNSEGNFVTEMQSHDLEPNVEFTDVTNAIRGESPDFAEKMPQALLQIKTHLGIKQHPIEVVGLNRDHGVDEQLFFNEAIEGSTFVNSFNGIAGNDDVHHYKVAIFKGLVYAIDMDGGLIFRRRINGDP